MTMKDTLWLGIALASTFVAGAGDEVATADFGKGIGTLNPALHSSGWTPRSTAMSQMRNPDIQNVQSMGFKYARTHDWALVNTGQRVVDLHFIFPLMHLDAKDPKNYVFGPTDHLLSFTRDCGLEIFYRLGTSIEHTGPKVHFNALIPEDFDKVAEIFAGMVRHYNKGWADGKDWNIKYWEIWNEPDGWNNMWCMPGGDTNENNAERRAKFATFFAICLKRIKSEFPDVKVGGPALCGMNEGYFQELFDACKKLGVGPDFISWHYYGKNPQDIKGTADRARALCDKNGLTGCELICNEWHFMDSDWGDLRSDNLAVSARVQDGPTGHNNIDSAAFTLANLALFQTSKLDQAYYYGCGHTGHWGYMNEVKQKNKNYYACCLFGKIMKEYATICESKIVNGDNYYTLAVKSADGTKKGLLLVDFRNNAQVIEVTVKGLGQAKRGRALVLDNTRDNFPCEVDFHDGRLTLVKPDKYSAAFFVDFQ